MKFADFAQQLSKGQNKSGVYCLHPATAHREMGIYLLHDQPHDVLLLFNSVV